MTVLAAYIIKEELGLEDSRTLSTIADGVWSRLHIKVENLQLDLRETKKRGHSQVY